MPTATITKKNVRRFNHMIVPHINNEPQGRYATDEELALFREAELEHERGEYYTWDPEKESLEDFFERIDADPIGTMACNSEEWKERSMA